MSTGNRLEFRSNDWRYGVQIGLPRLNAILGFCKRSGKVETGGILVGHYNTNYDNAIITAVTGAPLDSKFGRNWFCRGVVGLQSWLERLWYTNRHYYLGEWHFHPGGEPAPSQIDIRQMADIARTPKYHCPEPILLIVGKNPEDEPMLDCLGVYVFTSRRKMWELRLIDGLASERSVSCPS